MPIAISSLSSNNAYFYKTYVSNFGEQLGNSIIYTIELYKNSIGIGNTPDEEQEPSSNPFFSSDDIDPSNIWDKILNNLLIFFIRTIIIIHNIVIFILQEYFVTPYYFLKDAVSLKQLYEAYKIKIERCIFYNKKNLSADKLILFNLQLRVFLWDYVNNTINFIMFAYWFYFTCKLIYFLKNNKFYYKKEELPISYWFHYPEIKTKLAIKKFIHPFITFIIILSITTSIFILFFGFYYIQLISFSLITFFSSIIYLIAYKLYLSLILLQDTTVCILIVIYGKFYDTREDKKNRVTNAVFHDYIQQTSTLVLTTPYLLVSIFFYHFLLYIPYHYLCFEDDKLLNLNYTIYEFYSSFKKQTYFFKKVDSIKLNDDQWGSVIVYRLNLDYIECFIKLFGNLFYIFILINHQIFLLLVGIFYLIIAIESTKAFIKDERINAVTYIYLNRNGEFKEILEEDYVLWFIDKFKL